LLGRTRKIIKKIVAAYFIDTDMEIDPEYAPFKDQLVVICFSGLIRE